MPISTEFETLVSFWGVVFGVLGLFWWYWDYFGGIGVIFCGEICYGAGVHANSHRVRDPVSFVWLFLGN